MEDWALHVHSGIPLAITSLIGFPFLPSHFPTPHHASGISSQINSLQPNQSPALGGAKLMQGYS